VDLQAIASGQLGVDGRRVDAGVAELLLDLAQCDPLPELVDGRSVAEVPARSRAGHPIRAHDQHVSSQRVAADERQQ
jgi:hypothetical protein